MALHLMRALRLGKAWLSARNTVGLQDGDPAPWSKLLLAWRIETQPHM
jgi:hypothetical protein